MRTKTFDAVKLMRDLRDRLSEEMGHMTPDERVRFISQRAASTELGRKLAEGDRDAIQQADAADPPSAGG
ncbi:MAG: hypothetical protein HY812_14670 [Planctomycetes bacterium]|nr:hypothetical protein [Planctomycetota bacterium]